MKNKESLSAEQCNELIEEFRLFSFEYRVFYRLSLFIYKINLNRSPLNLYNHLKFNYSVNKGDHNLRNKDQLYISKNLNLDERHFSLFFSKSINITVYARYCVPPLLYKTLYCTQNSNYGFTVIHIHAFFIEYCTIRLLCKMRYCTQNINY